MLDIWESQEAFEKFQKTVHGRAEGTDHHSAEVQFYAAYNIDLPNLEVIRAWCRIDARAC